MIPQNHTFTVSELTDIIRTILEESFIDISLEGEISNYRPAASGHCYFTLSDREASISAVIFKGQRRMLSFNPENGMRVKIRGRISVYAPRGTYQIICSSMEIYGEGDILLMLEERKRRLAALGFFDPAAKKKLPPFPETIGIITSPTGAALQDILKVLNRRGCSARLVVLPSLVQGDNAPGELVKQLKAANRHKLADVLILARGGGSVEDLLPFSSEEVVQAVYNSEIPVISGIGHEIDTSLADLAADVRAATPSAAAEIVTNEYERVKLRISSLKSSLHQDIQARLKSVRRETDFFKARELARFFKSKTDYLNYHLDSLKERLTGAVESRLNRHRVDLNSCINTLKDTSPYSVLDRGYAWVSLNNKNIRSAEELNPGDVIDVRLSRGSVKAEVKEIQ